jgi:hypothetical protein
MRVSIAQLIRKVAFDFERNDPILTKILPFLEKEVENLGKQATKQNIDMVGQRIKALKNAFKLREPLTKMKFVKSLSSLNPHNLLLIEKSMENAFFHSGLTGKGSEMYQQLIDDIKSKDFSKDLPITLVLHSAETALNKMGESFESQKWGETASQLKAFKTYYKASEPIILRGTMTPAP